MEMRTTSCLAQNVLLYFTTFCLQCPRAAHALHLDNYFISIIIYSMDLHSLCFCLYTTFIACSAATPSTKHRQPVTKKPKQAEAAQQTTNRSENISQICSCLTATIFSLQPSPPDWSAGCISAISTVLGMSGPAGQVLVSFAVTSCWKYSAGGKRGTGFQ